MVIVLRRPQMSQVHPQVIHGARQPWNCSCISDLVVVVVAAVDYDFYISASSWLFGCWLAVVVVLEIEIVGC